MRLRIGFAALVLTLAALVVGCYPNKGRCAQPLPQVALKLPQVTINCPCPDGGPCVCKDTCLCGPTCKCSPDCPAKSDPLQLAANRKSGRWVALSNGDYEWKVGGVSEGIWSASTRQFRYHGQTKTQYVASTTDVVSFAPVNAVLGPPPMGPMMFGDCPGGTCRPR